MTRIFQLALVALALLPFSSMAQTEALWLRYPAISPDGSSIVYTSDTSGTKQLYIIGADGSDLRQITSGMSSNQSPAWRPTPT